MKTGEGRLVLGTWGLSGGFQAADGPVDYGSVPAETCAAVFDAAWEAGIRRVDTAPSYGGGNGYVRLAEWCARTGRQFQLVVKVGRPLVGGRPESRLDLDDLMAEVEAVKALLGPPETILVKDPPAEYLAGPRLPALLEQLALRHPGARVGVVSHLVASCAALAPPPAPWIAVIEYHGLNWWSAAPAAALLQQKGWEVWAMQPLAFGFLGGSCLSGRELAATDWRRRISPEDWRLRALAARSFLGRFTPRFPTVPAAVLAIAFCLSDPCVTAVVVGPKTVQQLGDSLEAQVLARAPEFRHLAASLRDSLQEAHAHRDSG